MLSPFRLKAVIGGVSELAREGVLSELLHAGNFFLISVTTEGLGNNFTRCHASESMCLKVNLGRTKVMISVKTLQKTVVYK